MNRMKMQSPNLVDQNIERIAQWFPNCITETQDENGNIVRAVDFDLLRQELSPSLVEGIQERYTLNWPGKNEAILAANAPIAKTLRPCEEESVDFDTTKNIFIEGDNLDVLKLLQETYLGKIKMIYIDPPYNTGNDFIYEDDFAEDVEEFLIKSNQKDTEGNRLFSNNDSNGRFHSDWLSLMYSRLKLAKNILREDGLLFISIDDNEMATLKRVCDEVFGERNFIGTVIWKNKYGAGAKTKGFIEVHEYILCYSRSDLNYIESVLGPEQIAKYEKLVDKNFPVRGGYITQPLMTTSLDDRDNLQYTIEYNGETISPRKQWVWSKERLLRAIENDEVVFKKKKNGEYSVRAKVYLKDENGRIRKGKPLSILNGPFNQEGTQEINGLFGKPIFSFPKPSKLIKYFFGFTVNENEDTGGIYMDFFSGSSSSANAVMELNAEDGGCRKFIMIQLPEPCDEKSEAFKAGFKTIAEIGKERIRLAGKKIKSKDPITTTNLDTGFRVFKVDSSNMKEVFYTPDEVKQGNLELFADHIKEDRQPEDLLFQVFLDWGLDLTLPIEKESVDKKTVFFVAENALAACFDKGISEDMVKTIAKRKPLRVVFRDDGFDSDSTKINVEQIFKLLSPETEVKTI